MKLKNLIFAAVTIMLIMFGANQTSAQQATGAGWYREFSTMNFDTLYISDSAGAFQGQYFVRTKFKGDDVSDQVIWGRKFSPAVPFQGTLRFSTRSYVLSFVTGTIFKVILYHSDTAISSEFVVSGDGPWGICNIGFGSGTLSAFDSLSIVQAYHPFTTVFKQQTTDFDAFYVKLNNQWVNFYDGGEWASVAGAVWFDQNQNGVKDQGEKPLSGIKVYKLYLGTSWLDSCYTNTQGLYQFQGRERGPHIIKPEPREFWTVTTHASGDCTLVINNHPLYYTDINFGLYSDQATAYAINPGWNMISVPKVCGNMAKTNLYPNAISQAFAYTSSSYIAKDTLETGKGYWIKFADSQAVIAGDDILQDTVEVVVGWNMIGAISRPVALSDIVSEPAGLKLSQFWGYNTRYCEIDSLRPNQGYWVKALEQGGHLILNSALKQLAKTTGQIIIIPIAESPPPAPDGSVMASLPEADETISQFRLGQNYPNPFNPSTTIHFSVMASDRGNLVTLKIYNLLGQEAATLVNEVLKPGKYSATWNAEGLPSGMYFYRLQSGSFTQTRKLLLMK